MNRDGTETPTGRKKEERGTRNEELRTSSFFIAFAVSLCLCGSSLAQPGLPPVFGKLVPDSIADLQEIETHAQKLIARVLPYTVCLQIGQGQGSGVIINRDGYILTAGHVSGQANKDVTIILHDGRRIRGKTLGANNGIDSGMVRITDHVSFPHAEMAKSAEVKKGQWCLALGHPGGYKPGRVPVVRLGRILETTSNFIVSDCPLVGGDSGGPLFDMHGKVIGINSRIGDNIHSNVHVPVDTYQETWARLSNAEVWGNSAPLVAAAKPGDVYLGVKAVADKKILRIQLVTPDSPAAQAGLRTDDVIVKVDYLKVSSVDELSNILRAKRPGVRLMIHVERAGATVAIPVILGKRPG